MSIHSVFTSELSKSVQLDFPPIVLRFANIKPRQLARFKMHDRRSGGDLQHIDLSKKSLNRIEHGQDNWIPKLKRRIKNMSKRNLKNEVQALRAKGRHKQAKARLTEGPKDPWNGNTDAPLREGVITVNKSWFGGAGAEAWDPVKVDRFRKHAMECLQDCFDEGELLYAASHSDEEAFHIHFVTVTWESKFTANRGQQIQLRAAANPVLRDYEHAQDLAGAHFEAIGITRGECRAAARREAKREGEPLPKKRRHVSPSEYREHERSKGQEEALVLKTSAKHDCSTALKQTRKRATRIERAARRKARKAEAKLATVTLEATKGQYRLEGLEADCAKALCTKDAAVADADRILEHARVQGVKTIHKSRSRAIKEAKARKAKAEREVAQTKVEYESVKNAVKLVKEELVTACHDRAAVRAEVNEGRKTVAVVGAKRSQISEALDRETARLKDVVSEAALAQKQRDEAIEAATSLTARAEVAKQKADAALRGALEQEAMVQAQTKQLQQGLVYLAEGVLAYRPATTKKPEGLKWGPKAPEKKSEKQDIVDLIGPILEVLILIAKMIVSVIERLLSKERADLRGDLHALDEVRAEMGIESGETLNDLRARYTDSDDGLGM